MTDISETAGCPFIWYELLTTDLDAAIAFYEQVVGWSITDSGLPDRRYMILSAEGQAIGGMMQLPAEALAQGARPAWVGYIGVADIDATLAAIVADGGAVHMPATDMIGVGRFAFVTDPSGAAFYLMTPSNAGQSSAFHEGKHGHVAWNELYADELEPALAFYQRHFGWKLFDAMDMGEMGPYQFFGLAKGTLLGAMMKRPPQVPHAAWLHYVFVDDIDAAVTRTTAAGATIINGPMEVPGNQFIINAIDPQGASFSLVGNRAA